MQKLAFLPVVAAGLDSVAAALAAEKPAAPSIDAKAYAQAVDRAVDFLEHKAQAPDGSYAAYAGPGVTAVVTTAILRHGRRPTTPWSPRA